MPIPREKSPDSKSPLNQRPIGPLPKPLLHERLSPDITESIKYPSAPPKTAYSFYDSYKINGEDTREQLYPVDQKKTEELEGIHIPRRNDEEIDNDEEYHERPERGRYARQSRDATNISYQHVQKPGPSSHAKPEAPPSRDDGYDSLDDTNNKKERERSTLLDAMLNDIHSLKELGFLETSSIIDEPFIRKGDVQGDDIASTAGIRYQDIPNIFLEAVPTCIATSRLYKRCKHPVSVMSRQAAAEMAFKFKINASSTDPSENELEKLATLLLCRRYHWVQSIYVAKAWYREIQLGIVLNASPLASGLQSSRYPAVAKGMQATTSSEFRQYGSQSSDISIIKSLLKYMRKPLRMTNATGFVYMFARPGISSMIRICSTTTAIETSLQQWAQCCSFKPLLLYDAYNHPTSNIDRVESLILTSLARERRLEVVCNDGNGCSSRHNQWFEIDIELALATTRRWREWMSLHPYTERNLDVFWELKLQEAEDLPDLDSFHKWIEKMIKSCHDGETPWRGRADRLPGIEAYTKKSTARRESSPVPSILSVDVPSLVSGPTLSSAITDGPSVAASDEVLSVLLSDTEIERLCNRAFNIVGADRFERNFYKLLKTFSKDLQAEASEYFDRKAALFIRSHTRNIAKLLRLRLGPIQDGQSERFHTILIQNPERADLLERYLQDGQAPEASIPNLDQEDIGDLGVDPNIKFYSSDDSDSDPELNSSSLEQVRSFVARSVALSKFRDNLRDFILPGIRGKGVESAPLEVDGPVPTEGATDCAKLEVHKLDPDVSGVAIESSGDDHVPALATKGEQIAPDRVHLLKRTLSNSTPFIIDRAVTVYNWLRRKLAEVVSTTSGLGGTKTLKYLGKVLREVISFLRSATDLI
jgi:T5orf172 domain